MRKGGEHPAVRKVYNPPFLMRSCPYVQNCETHPARPPRREVAHAAVMEIGDCCRATTNLQFHKGQVQCAQAHPGCSAWVTVGAGVAAPACGEDSKGVGGEKGETGSVSRVCRGQG